MTKEELRQEYRECGKRLEILRYIINEDAKKTGIYQISEERKTEFERLTNKLKELDSLIHGKENE